MGLQRTPPPGKAPLARENEAGPSNQAGNTSLPSPSQAFAPRNPRVMRSPQSGSTHASSSTSSRPAAAPVTHPEPRSTIPAAPTTPAPSQYLQPMDEGNVSTTPLTAPPAPALVAPTPIHQQSVEEAQDLPMEEIIEPIQLAPPTTPAPKRRKSRHHSKAPPPIPDEAGDAPTESVQSTTIHTQAGVVDYGERHRRMLETLQIAVTSSSQKMTLKEFRECFPMLAAQNKEISERWYEDTKASLKQDLWAEASATLEAQGFGMALSRIDEAVREAKYNATNTEYGRPNAWRPDLSAKTISAAANLPVYDETYSRLRTEYLGLHEDCSKRYASIAKKQAELKQLEATVSDGVVDLEKTVETMQDFPTEEMRRWMEDIMPSLDNARSA